MGKNRVRGIAPVAISDTISSPTVPTDHNRDTPKFCLRHLQHDYNVEALTKDQRAAFAMALQKRAAMTWSQIIMAGRHGLGSENIPSSSIRASIPYTFQDASEFVVLRYDGNLPMAGVRVGSIFHILWIEPEFGRLYKH